MLEELYVYHSHKLPYGGRECNMLKELFEAGAITSESIDRLLELTAENINALMNNSCYKNCW